jgi:hypothetical protein
MNSGEFGRMLDGHLDPEVISDLVGGLLTQEQAASLDRHFVMCPECQDMRDSLAQVRYLLSHLPVEPMPAGVARRLDRALSAEAKRRPTGAEPAGAARLGRRAVRSLSEARAWRAEHLPRLAKVAAAVVVVVGGGVLGFAIVDNLRSSGGSDTESTAQAPAQERRSGAAGAAQAQVTSSGREYTKEGLASQVTALLATGAYGQPGGSGGLTATRTPGTASSKRVPKSLEVPNNGRSAADAGAQLAPCVLAATGHAATVPRAVDLGTYQNRRVAVVVLPGRTNHVDVYVVDLACQGDRADLLNQLEVALR